MAVQGLVRSSGLREFGAAAVRPLPAEGRRWERLFFDCLRQTPRGALQAGVGGRGCGDTRPPAARGAGHTRTHTHTPMTLSDPIPVHRTPRAPPGVPPSATPADHPPGGGGHPPPPPSPSPPPPPPPVSPTPCRSPGGGWGTVTWSTQNFSLRLIVLLCGWLCCGALPLASPALMAGHFAHFR